MLQTLSYSSGSMIRCNFKFDGSKVITVAHALFSAFSTPHLSGSRELEREARRDNPVQLPTRFCGSYHKKMDRSTPAITPQRRFYGRSRRDRATSNTSSCLAAATGNVYGRGMTLNDIGEC